MAKIYISATYFDLQECREQVSHILRRMGHKDASLEYFVFEDRRPVDKCLTDVAACDVYVGIFAWRYGWIPVDNNPNQISVTEMEYLQAIRVGKPCLIFLQDGKAPWPPEYIDSDRTRIKKFRSELTEKHGIRFFKTQEDLTKLVAEAIYTWEEERGYTSIALSIPEYKFEAYFSALKKRYGVLALEGLTPPQKEEYLQIQLRSVFIEQNLRENPPPVELPKEVWEKLQREKDIHPEDLPSGITLEDFRRSRDVYYEKPTRPVLDVLTDARYQQTIILGDPGSGKSTLARYIMLSLIEPTGDEKIRRAFDGYLPLLIELRTYTGACLEGNCGTFLEFLEYLGKTEGYHLTQEALHNHLKNDGRAVVIFDGLDEIFDPEKREQITRQIVGFCNDYPKAHIIVTSRVIGYRRKVLTDAGFTHFTIQDLDEKQVETFVNRLYDLAMSDRPDEAKERQGRILKSFKESASIRQLAGNPMLLTIMAIIGKHQELPRERWKLYDHAASVLIQHWDVNKHLKEQLVNAEFIGEEDKKELLRRLAFKMQGAEGGLAGNYIHRDQLQVEFEGYLTERYSQTPDRAKVIAEAMIQQFCERNFILSLYGANLYGFVHRAFLEYFCASAFVYKFEKTKELTIEELKTDVYGKHWKDQTWHEVLQLICGMIDEKWAGAIIDLLLSYEIDFSGGIILPINVASQCLDEIRNRKVIICTVKRLVEGWIALLDSFGTLPFDASSQIDLLLGKVVGERIANAGSSLDDIHGIILDYVRNESEKRRFLTPYALAVGWINDKETKGLIEKQATNDTSELVRAVAISALAEHYNEDAQTLPFLRDRAINDTHGRVRSAAVNALGQYFQEDAQTLPFLRDRALNDAHERVRSAAVNALGQYFHEDAQTLPFLRDRAVNDSAREVRSSAVRALGGYFREDTQTLPLLRDRAVNDSNEDVRSSAVRMLGDYFSEDAQTLPLLHDRAVNDSAGEVRSSAVSSLAQYFSEDSQTLPLLRDSAVNDSAEDVRSSAVEALGQYFREDDFTLPLLHERAQSDESPTPDDKKEGWEKYVREIAINAIAKYWPNHPDTMPLLKDRAKNDPTPWLRKRAKELIRELTEKRKKLDNNLTRQP